MDFKKLHDITKSWIMANIVCYNGDRLARELHKWIESYGEIIGYEQVVNKKDAMLILHLENETWISFLGTKNTLAWLSNLTFWLYKGFHKGIAKSTIKILNDKIQSIPHGKTVYITGQSRGGAMALYANLMLKKAGYKTVKSYGFASPYIAGRNTGYEELKDYSVDHTRVNTDPGGPLPSDPVDDVGGLRCRHYGKAVDLMGNGFITDHSYKAITKNLIMYIIKTNLMDTYKYDMYILSRVCEELAKK